MGHECEMAGWPLKYVGLDEQLSVRSDKMKRYDDCTPGRRDEIEILVLGCSRDDITWNRPPCARLR